MSYRCQACNAVVPPGKPRLVHVDYYGYDSHDCWKANRQIRAEVPVCAACKQILDGGKTLAELQSRGSVPAPAKGLNWLDEEQANAND